MNLAALLQGLLNGLDYALLAVGLVLVFRASKFVNAAHAQLGVVSSLVLGKLVVDNGWPYWAAFVVAVLTGMAIAAAVEMLVIRKLAHCSALTLFIVSTGVAQLLLALTFVEAFQPDAQRIVIDGYPVPFDVTHEIGGFVVRGQHVFTLVAAPLVAGAIAAVLRYTMIGKAVRAAASNGDAARLAAVPVRRISTGVWATAGLLSAITAILQAPSQPVLSLQALGPGLLLRALAAAALAGFTSLTGAFAVGAAIGVVEGVLLSTTHSGGVTELVMFVAIVAGLLVRQRAFADRRRRTVASRAKAVEPIRVPAALAHHPLVRLQRPVLWFVGAALAVLLPFLPQLHDEGDRFLLAVVVAYALVAVSVTVLSGWSGQISLGQFAIVGVGCFVSARLADRGWSLGQIAVAAALAGAVTAVVVGLPTVRSRGMLLAVTSLGFALIASEWLFRQGWLAGTPGETVAPLSVTGLGQLRTQLSVYFAGLVLLGLVLLATSALRNTAPGRAIVAVRDNDDAAAAFGLSPVRVRLTALAVSGAIAGLGGVLWLAAWRNSDVARFGPDNSFIVLALPVVGGLESIAGAVLGAALIIGIPMFTTDLFEEIFSNSAGFVLLLSGAGLVLTQLQFPAGAAGACRRWWQAALDRMARSTATVDAPDAVPTALSSEPAAGELQKRRDPAAGSDGVVSAVAPVVAAAGSGVVLRVTDARVSFGGIVALDGVSLEVREGEIVGLIGANGAGKTTLFDVIAGAIEPDAGEVELAGHDVTRLPTHERSRLGMARSFQDARLFPGLTVLETVEVACAGARTGSALASLAGAPWATARERDTHAQAGDIVGRFRLDRWADAQVSTLSTGTRRVCDFASQLARRPRLLLLDEPTAGIAQRDAEAFAAMIRDLRAELECSILVIEHDLPMLLGIVDRLYAMESGRIIASGAPDAVRGDAAVIASYLGTTPAAIERSSGPARVQAR